MRRVFLFLGLWIVLGTSPAWAQDVPMSGEPGLEGVNAAPVAGVRDAWVRREMPLSASAARALERALQQPAAKPRDKDSVGNGIAIGAAVGAATMFTVISILYAQCDEGCDAPAFSELGLPVTAFGAGVGAVAGWLIDRVK